jgi:hypothetical protein
MASRGRGQRFCDDHFASIKERYYYFDIYVSWTKIIVKGRLKNKSDAKMSQIILMFG